MTRPVAAAIPAKTRLRNIILCRLLLIVSGNCGVAPTALGNAIRARRSTPSDVTTTPSHASSRIDVYTHVRPSDSHRARKFPLGIRTGRNARRAVSDPYYRLGRRPTRERFRTGIGLDPPLTGTIRVGPSDARMNFLAWTRSNHDRSTPQIESAPGNGHGKHRLSLVREIAPHH